MITASLAATAFVLSALASAGLVGMVLVYVRRRQLLDIPGPRSAHTVPTPRGAGVVFPLPLLLTVLLLWQADMMTLRSALALGLSLVLMSLLGWLEDHRSPGVGPRLLGHTVIVVLGLWLFGPLPALRFGPLALPGTGPGIVVLVIAMVWFVNAFNFMDGADGFAATQTLAAAGAAALLAATGGDLVLSMLAAVLAGVAAGFLVWNRAPARVFMGDAGSYGLGLAFCLLALFGEARGSMPAFAWAILLAPFVWDASLTLLSRLRHGRAVLRPHREHAYQRLLLAGWDHARLARMLAILCVLVTWPAAAAATLRADALVWGFSGSALIMCALWMFIRRRHAGVPLREAAE